MKGWGGAGRSRRTPFINLETKGWRSTGLSIHTAWQADIAAKYLLTVEAAKSSSKRDYKYWRTYCTSQDSGTTSIPVHQEQINHQRNWYAAVVASALAFCMVFITPSCSPNMDHCGLGH